MTSTSVAKRPTLNPPRMSPDKIHAFVEELFAEDMRISVDPVPGDRHAFGGIRLLLRMSQDGVEFMVRNTH